MLRGLMSRLAAGLALLAAAAGSAAAQPALRSCSITSQNIYVRDVLLDLYLWYDTIPAVDPARYPDPASYLAAVRHRPLDAHFSYIADAASTSAFYDDSQFVGYGFSTRVEGTFIRVLQVFPDSPAAEAGLARGDRIVAVEGVEVQALIESGRIDSAFGPAEAGTSVEIVFVSTDGRERRQRMVKRVVAIPTVSLTRIYEVDGRRVGYLFFRNFVRPSVAALDEAFAALREAGVSELILDLRYNGGGLVDVARHLGSLIGGAPTTGQIFATYAHSDRQAHRDDSLRFEALERPGPALSRLIAFTSRSSASASELVLNALSPFMPVILVGDATYGKPVGQYLIEFCDKVLAPVAFSMRNADNEGDYFEGLPVTCPAADGVDRQLGDAEEASLAEALHYVRHEACSLPPEAAAARPARRPGPQTGAGGWRALLNAW